MHIRMMVSHIPRVNQPTTTQPTKRLAYGIRTTRPAWPEAVSATASLI